MLEKTEGAIKNGQSREAGNIGHKRHKKQNKNDNPICVVHHYTIYKISRERNMFKDLFQMCIENTRISLIFTKYILFFPLSFQTCYVNRDTCKHVRKSDL